MLTDDRNLYMKLGRYEKSYHEAVTEKQKFNTVVSKQDYYCVGLTENALF